MNKTLAFLFVIAMTAAGIFAVKWQNAVAEMEVNVRKAAREAAVVTTPPPQPNQKGQQEVKRLESELQNLRVQMVNQPDAAAAAHQREIEMLTKENQMLQSILSNALKAASTVQPVPVAAPVEVIEPVPEVLAEQDPAGLGVIGMNEFRELNWRQGTMPAYGAAVISVQPGSPAMTAGIQVGDIITSMGNTTIDGPGTFNQTIAELLPGSATQVTLNRDRAEIVVVLLNPVK